MDTVPLNMACSQNEDGEDGGGEIKTAEDIGKLCTAGSVTDAIMGLQLQSSSISNCTESATVSLHLLLLHGPQRAPHAGVLANPARQTVLQNNIMLWWP